MAKNRANVDVPRPVEEGFSPQLTLSFNRTSAEIVQFPKSHAGTTTKSSDATLKRLLEYAESLPGK
jgi:hypothetical protein